MAGKCGEGKRIGGTAVWSMLGGPFTEVLNGRSKGSTS